MIHVFISWVLIYGVSVVQFAVFFFFYSSVVSRMSGSFCLWVNFPLGVLAFLTWVVTGEETTIQASAWAASVELRKEGAKRGTQVLPGLAFPLSDLLPGSCFAGSRADSWALLFLRTGFLICNWQVPRIQSMWGGENSPSSCCFLFSTLSASWAFLPLMPGILAAAVFLSCGGCEGPRCILTVFTVVLHISTSPLAAEVSLVLEQKRTPRAGLQLHTSSHCAPWYLWAFCRPTLLQGSVCILQLPFRQQGWVAVSPFALLAS